MTPDAAVPGSVENDAQHIERQADLVAALLRLPYLSARQCSVVVQTSPSHIRRACLSGDLAAIRIGSRQWRVTPTALTAWLSGSRSARTLGRVS